MSKNINWYAASGGTTRLTRSKKESGTGSSTKDKDREMAKALNAEFSDDAKDDDLDSNWDEDEKGHEDDDDDVSTEKKLKRKKEKQDSANIEDEEDKDEDGKDVERDIKQEDEEDEAENEDNEKGERTIGSDELPSRRDGKRFIKLNCPHCSHHSVTFKEYTLHLYSGRHKSAMRRIAARHKATLARMRVLQRQEQKRVEMKRFITPFCRVCRIQFRSPMLFESHICSLDHIKRKSLMDERLSARNGEAEADSSGAEDDDKEVNLDNFMTLDSVGDVDEEEDETAVAAVGDKKKKIKLENNDGATLAAAPTAASPTNASEMEKKPKNKQMIKVGLEYIKRVEVQFCELCKVYLPRNESSERAVALHCSTRSHLKRYVRDNDDKALRRQAERIHLQTSTTVVTTIGGANNPPSTPENTKNDINQANDTGSMTIASSATSAIAATAGSDVENNSNSGAGSASGGGGGGGGGGSGGGGSNKKNDEPESNKETKDGAQEETSVPADLSKDNAEEEYEDEYRGDLGDKLWDDVDKDLGDILREAEPGAKSSDDEDSRYDRFRNSEKISPLGKDKERGDENKDADGQETAVAVTSKKVDTKIKVEKIDK